jgi:hypothetical protein
MKTKPDECEWKQDKFDGHWIASCGLEWEFCGGANNPKEHQMNFCPKCGRIIEAK